MVIMSVFFASFLLKSFALFFRPITGKYLPFWLYWSLSYTIPFIVPSSFQLYYIYLKLKLNKSINNSADSNPLLGESA